MVLEIRELRKGDVAEYKVTALAPAEGLCVVHIWVVLLFRRWRCSTDWSFSSSQPLYAPANYHACSSLSRPTPRGILPETIHVLKPRCPTHTPVQSCGFK